MPSVSCDYTIQLNRLYSEILLIESTVGVENTVTCWSLNKTERSKFIELTVQTCRSDVKLGSLFYKLTISLIVSFGK